MDSQNFRRQTHPTFSPIINEAELKLATRKFEAPEKLTASMEDVRYPGYADHMEDGRLVTDYTSHCAKNVAPSYQGNSLRHWLQNNSDAFIQVSRKRQADRAGAQYYMADTVLGQKYYQKCDEYDCSFSATGERRNIGLGRREPVPELFGTFSHPRQISPGHRISLTDDFKGGRNTPHGREYKSLGNQSFNPRNSQYGSNG